MVRSSLRLVHSAASPTPVEQRRGRRRALRAVISTPAVARRRCAFAVLESKILMAATAAILRPLPATPSSRPRVLTGTR